VVNIAQPQFVEQVEGCALFSESMPSNKFLEIMKIPKVRLEVWKTKSTKGKTLFGFIFEEPF